MDKLSEAARDARPLLERGYPRDRVLDLVGDHWDLDAAERHVLRRAVFAPSQARRRAARLLAPGDIAGREVAVDGHNVIITLQSALTGRTLVLGDDGVIRDVSGIGRNHRPDQTTLQAARLMLGGLQELSPDRVDVLLHARLPQSGDLAAGITNLMAELGLTGRSETTDSVRRRLAEHSGPVASGDAAVLEAGDAPFDLAGCILRGWEPAPAWVSLS